MSKITVGIPTIIRKSLTKTLEALMNQKEDDFDVLITYKGNLTREIEEYEKKLNIKFIRQESGFFEDALELILKNAKGKILLTTDDDAIPYENWIKDHVKFHDENKKAGIVSGEIEGRMWINYPNELKKKFEGTTYMEEYNGTFKDYVAYLTKTGLSIDRDERRYGLSLAIAGVNMSIKREVYTNCKVIKYSLRGSYNETLLALQAIKMGYSSVKAKIGLVSHLDTNSLSRPKAYDFSLKLEKFTLPYAVNFIFPLDIQLLEEFKEKIGGEARIGIDLAVKGIKESLKPEEFRRELGRTIEALYSKRRHNRN
ncbi:MAG: glycosyltransferase [Sulfolobus sp.]